MAAPKPSMIEDMARGMKVGSEFPIVVLRDYPVTFRGFPVEPGDYILRYQHGAEGNGLRLIPAGVEDPLTVSAEEVDHPAHYGGADDPYEAIKVIEAWGANFHVGTVLKYLSRAGKKPGEAVLKDLKKARWYLDRYIETLEKA